MVCLGYGGGAGIVVVMSYLVGLAVCGASLVVLLRRRALRWSELPAGRRRVALALSGCAVLCPVVGLTLAVARVLAGLPLAPGAALMPWVAAGLTCNAASIVLRTSRRAGGVS